MDYSWENLTTLLDQAGGSAYIARPDRFVANVIAMRSALTTRYPNIGMGYSYKTNYLPRFCLEAEQLGLYAEVVSGNEYQIANCLGIGGKRIIFNGPVKSTPELEKAFEQGALVNVDSFSEAVQIRNIARNFPAVLRVGLRCNLDLQWKGRESRFGLSETSGELDAAWKTLSGVGNISLEGMHCHTSFDRSAGSYRLRMARLIEIADRLFGDKPISFLDIGGGFCGPMPRSLQIQFADPPPTFDDYAESICAPMRQRYGDSGPELIVEPGVGLVGNAFDYAYRVEHIKKVGERRFAVTSGAAHQIKIVPNEINPPTRAYRPQKSSTERYTGEPTDVVGFTCLEHDVLVRDFKDEICERDILVSESTGAYSMASSPDFIRTTPPVVEYIDGEWRILRKKLTTTHLLDLFSW